MKFGKLLFASLIAIIGFTSCCCKEKVNIEDKAWKLVELNGETNAAFAEGEFFTLEFLSEEKRMAGAGAVNRFFGTYMLDKENLILNLAGTTMMAGPNMELEDAMFNALKEVASYEIKDGELILKSAKAKVAKFKTFEKQ